MALAVSGAAGPPAAAPEGSGPAWPLAASARELSATFMEPRGGRYHAGIDVRTGGVIGTPVVAPEAGWVARLRASPQGYGKAVYLETDAGVTYVFAHLAAFADGLAARVVAAQAAAGRYELDLALPKRELQVERGELLAVSGDTGAGAPHLHFEVRDRDEIPRNPLLAGFAVPDRLPPRVRRLRLLALDGDARVAGGVQPLELAPGDTVEAHGLLGVQAEIVDHTTPASPPLMPLGAQLLLDGSSRFRLEQQSCPFPLTGQMRLELDDPASATRRRWMRLYRREGSTLPGRQAERRGASFELAADGGLHRVVVRAWDAADNRDSALVWLRAQAPRAADSTDSPAPKSLVGWRLELTPLEGVLELRAEPPAGTAPGTRAGPRAGRTSWSRARLRVKVGDADEIELTPTVDAAGRRLVGAVEWGRLRTGPLRATLHTDTRSPAVAQVGRLLAVGGTGGWTLREVQTGWELADTTRGALAPGGAVWLAAAPKGLALPSGARMVGEAVAIEGAGAAMLSPLRLGLRSPAEGTATAAALGAALADPRVGLYARDAQGKWNWLGARRWRDPQDGAELLGASIDAPAVVAALLDSQPPVLRRFELNGTPVATAVVSIAPRTRRAWKGITLPRWPALVLPLTDACAGLEAAGIAVTLDGNPFPARWDPEAERLHLEFAVDPGPGEHLVAVDVTDRAGNQRGARQRLVLTGAR